MPVTSDTLFHFTNSLENLKGILSEKFKLTYCHEEYILDYETHDSYYPMVSFCDIPLSLTKDQITKYGPYAIGMTKDWGIKNGLNPVVYIEKNSLLAKDIQATIDSMVRILGVFDGQAKKATTLHEIVTEMSNKMKSFGGMKPANRDLAAKELVELTIEKLLSVSNSVEEYKELLNKIGQTGDHHNNLFRYIKNYKGELIRSGIAKDYRFYDEREWRYVPALNTDGVHEHLNADEYKEFKGDREGKRFIDDINLAFEADDIKYLIVNSSDDIPHLIKAIKRLLTELKTLIKLIF